VATALEAGVAAGRAAWRGRADRVRPVRRADLPFVAVVVLGAGLRVWGLGAQSLWYDEWLTAEATSGGLGDMVHHVANREGIPVPWFGFMWVWARRFGDGEAVLRAPSAVAGIATIPVAYLVVRQLGQPRAVARVAALLVAVNPMLVWYSQEARPYSILAFAGALSLLVLLRSWAGDRRRDAVAWAVVCACAVAIHYFAVFLVAAEAAALLAARHWPWRRVLVACGPTVAVLAALGPLAAEQHSHDANRSWITNFPLAERLADAGRSALVGPSPPTARLWVAAAVALVVPAVLLLTRVVRTGGSADRRLGLTTTGGIGVLAVVLAVIAAGVAVDAVVGRYLIASLVPLVVAAALALGATRPRWVGGAVVVGLCAVSLAAVVAVARDPDLQRPDWRSVAAASGDDRGLLVLNTHGRLAGPLRYYLPEARPLGPRQRVDVEQIDVLVANPTSKPCNFLVGRACSLVFLGAPLPGPLASRVELVRRIRTEQFTLDRYRASGPLSVTFADLVAEPDRANALVLAYESTS
jgi:mannosyltransferase